MDPTLLVLACSALLTAEPRIDLREDLRTLQAQAAKSLDLWTLVQIDAYAARENLRQRPCLPGISLIGDPLFTCPEPIVGAWECDEQVVVLSGNTVRRWATDGRPLAAALALPARANAGDCDPGGRWLAVVARERVGAEVRIHCASVDMTTGTSLIDVSLAGNADEDLGPVVIAADGSAIAVRAVGEDANGNQAADRLLLATAGGIRALDNMRHPLAIGADGAWLVARNAGGQPILTIEADRRPVLDVARGSTGTVIVSPRGLELLRRDPKILPLPAGFAFGSRARVVTLGGWLVAASGPGALTLPSTDLLGQPTPGGKPQPETIAVWRWKDLGGAELPLPFATWQTPLAVVAGEHALLRRVGRSLDRLDLTATDMVSTAILEAPVPIVSVNDRMGNLVVELEDGRYLMADSAGQELWIGPASDIEVQHAGWAVATREDKVGPRWLGVSFTPDPAARQEVDLHLEPGPWEVLVHPSGNWALAWQEDGRWRRIALPSGKVSSAGETVEDRPALWDAPESAPRWAPVGGHLVRSRQPATTFADLHPIDAWRMGRASLVLSRNGRVWALDPRGTLVQTDRCRDAHRFGMIGNHLVVADEAGLTLAELVAGPKLDIASDLVGQQAEEMPIGPWRAENDRYVPPRAGTLTWNPATGFVPRRLRNPDNECLLAVTASAILVLDAQTARLAGHGL